MRRSISRTYGQGEWEWAGLDDYGVDYAVPLGPSGTTLSVAFTRSDDLVVDDRFADLDIDSESISLYVTLRQRV